MFLQGHPFRICYRDGTGVVNGAKVPESGGPEL